MRDKDIDELTDSHRHWHSPSASFQDTPVIIRFLVDRVSTLSEFRQHEHAAPGPGPIEMRRGRLYLLVLVLIDLLVVALEEQHRSTTPLGGRFLHLEQVT